MLLNLSNHPSVNWPANQKEVAISKYSTIEDLSFPQIPPTMDEDELNKIVEEYEIKVRQLDPTAVHLMGEMTFTFRLVTRLKSIGIPCIASTTERIAAEDKNGNKISLFKFVNFRNY